MCPGEPGEIVAGAANGLKHMVIFGGRQMVQQTVSADRNSALERICDSCRHVPAYKNCLVIAAGYLMNTALQTDPVSMNVIQLSHLLNQPVICAC